MFTRTFFLTAFVLGLLMLAGCSAPPKLERIGVRIKELSPSGATATLLFVNPNNIPLVVPSTEHTITLDGISVGTIRNSKPLGIPPLGSVAESIPLSDAIAQKITRIAATHPGPAIYVIESTLDLNWDNDIHAYRTSDRGSVSLASSPVAAP